MGVGPGPPAPSEPVLNTNGHTSGGLWYLYEAATSGDICEISKTPSGTRGGSDSDGAGEDAYGGFLRLVPGVGALGSVMTGRAAGDKSP
jgi:hypothetical protein